MRVIETSLEEDLSLFSRYLWRQRVRHRIFEERGRQVLEVSEDEAAEPVREAYRAWQNGALVLQSQTVEVPAGERFSRALALLQRFPVLIALLGIALLVFPFSLPVADGNLTAVTGALTIVDLSSGAEPGLTQLLQGGEFWRWFTPVFLHFSVVHLLFNLAVVTDFGRRVEIGRGSGRLALIVLIVGVASNLVQFAAASNPLFGGLSGVAYGLLGYVLVSQRRFPHQVAWQVHPGFAFSLLLFLVLFSTGVTEQFGLHVANYAHWAGLISGAALALVLPLPARDRR
jgi:GlpG protein